SLSRGQPAQDSVDLFPSNKRPSHIARCGHVLRLYKVSDGRVILFSDRCLKGDRLDSDPHHFADAIDRQPNFAADLFLGRLALQLLLESGRGLDDLVDQFSHIDRDPDRTSLVDNGASDSSANPPRRVRAKPESLSPVELLDGPDQ